MSFAPSLHVADRLEGLWDHLGRRLVEVLRAESLGRIVPVPPWVVVPSSVVGEWLQVEVARSLGVAMGARFVSAGDFWSALGAGGFGEAEAELAEGYRAWAPEALRWRILPEVGSVAGELGFGDARGIRPRERFAAAELVARELDRTLRSRPTWARWWRAGRAALQPTSSVETWQRELWRRLALAEGMPRHPAEIVDEVGGVEEGETESGSGGVGAKPAVVWVALGEIEPLVLRTLRWLAGRGWLVDVEVLLPSLGYFGDLPARRDRREKFGAISVGEGEVLPNDFLQERAHPLLVSLGQQAAGVFWLLGELDDDYAAWPAWGGASVASHGKGSLLAHLQARVRAGGGAIEERPARADADCVVADASLRVHECHGVRRELEVLRDELLRAFRELPDLRPEQVRVAAVDFDAYASLAEAVLKRPAPGLERGLPVRLTVVAARTANPVLVALMAWLRMLSGRQSASELLELLTLEAVKHRLEWVDEAEDYQSWLNRVRASGLTHGLGVLDGGEEGTFSAARDRVTAGFWFGPVDAGVSLSGGGWLIPVGSVLADDEAASRRLLDWWLELERSLREGIRPARARTWAERLRRAVDGLFRSPLMEEAAVACLQWVAELELVAAEEDLDAGAILDWLSPRLDNATSLRTTLDGSVVFGRLEQIRGLPCRVLAILGLQDEAFPRADRRPAWSLLAQKPERGDSDVRCRDRQLFLDLLLTPTDRLILSASNRNRRTGHDGPLAACVEEVLRAAAEVAGLPPTMEATAAWRIKHALHPFDPGYFASRDARGGHSEKVAVGGAGLPPSFDAEAADTAHRVGAVVGGQVEAAPFYAPAAGGAGVSLVAGLVAGGADAPGQVIELSLESLIAFWKNPARGWLKALGVAQDVEEPDDRELDDAPITLDGRQNHRVATAVLDYKLGADANAQAVRARLAVERVLPPGALGGIVWSAREADLRPLVEALKTHLQVAHSKPVEVTLEVKDSERGLDCACRLVGEVVLKPGDGGGSGSQVLVYRPGKYSEKDDVKYRLEAWVRTLAAAVVSGQAVGGLVCGTEVDKGSVEKRTDWVSPGEARVHLTRLVVGYLEGQTRPLPYAPQTSEAIRAALVKNPDDEATVLEAGRVAWEGSGYGQMEAEGREEAALLAWRGRDPFVGEDGKGWLAWARWVADPLHAWWEGARLAAGTEASQKGMQGEAVLTAIKMDQPKSKPRKKS